MPERGVEIQRDETGQDHVLRCAAKRCAASGAPVRHEVKPAQAAKTEPSHPRRLRQLRTSRDVHRGCAQRARLADGAVGTTYRGAAAGKPKQAGIGAEAAVERDGRELVPVAGLESCLVEFDDPCPRGGRATYESSPSRGVA